MAGPVISTICLTPGTPTLLSGTPTFHLGQDGFTAVREVVVPWDDMESTWEKLLPPSTFVGGVQTVAYGAAFPGRDYLRVIDIDIKPLSPNKPLSDLDFNGDYKYEHAKFVVKYGFLRNQPAGGSGAGTDPRDPVKFLIHRWSIGAEVIKTDTVGLVWDNVLAVPQPKDVSGSRPPNPISPWPPKMANRISATGTLLDADNPLGKPPSVSRFIGRIAEQEMKQGPREYVALIEHEITRQRVPRPPFTAMRECVGKCNNAVVELKTGRIPAECLIFWGAQLQSQVMSNGEESWEMNMRFGERRVIAEDQVAPGGWNHYYRDVPPEKVRATATGALTTPFPGVSVVTADGYTGRRGFYRLEKTRAPAERRYNDTLPGNAETDFALGYDEETAIVKQKDFSRLWLPEPTTTST